MAISEVDRNDVISTVLIEMERMFTVLSARFPATLADQSQLLDKIEDTFRNSLINLDASGDPIKH
jgi:hypothetical protein